MTIGKAAWTSTINTRERGHVEKGTQYISYCGKYYCASCDYHKGTIVKVARTLLAFAERYGSLKLIADSNNVCNFDEFIKGLKWLASQEKPCKGCRFGGGWS